MAAVLIAHVHICLTVLHREQDDHPIEVVGQKCAGCERHARPLKSEQ